MAGVAHGAFPLADTQVLDTLVDMTAHAAGLGRREEAVNLYDPLAVPFRLVLKEAHECAPACIRNVPGKGVIMFHVPYVQILYADCIVSPHKRNGAFVKVVHAAVRDLLVKPGNLESLVFKPAAALLLPGQVLLRTL